MFSGGVNDSPSSNEDLFIGGMVENEDMTEIKIQSDFSKSNIGSAVATTNTNVDMKNRFAQLYDIIENKVTTSSDLLNIRSMLEEYKGDTNRNYRERFNSLWWSVANKIRSTKDFENLEQVLEMFKTGDDSDMIDPSVLNSTVNTKPVRRYRHFFEKK